MEQSFQDIVVPTDGSDPANRALDHAIDLATRVDASIHVLSVVSTPELETAVDLEPAREAAWDRVESAAEQIDQADITNMTVVRTGTPSQEILDYIEKVEADLVAMGTHGRSGLDRYLIGSVAEKVVRLAAPPVLTVHSSSDARNSLPYDDLLVPTDGSEHAEVALRPAITLAKAYDASLHTLSVVNTSALGPDVRSTAVLESLETRAVDAADSAAETAMENDVSSVETATAHGRPHTSIRDYVDEHGIDLVAIGTHGRTGLKRAVIGSVAERTVRTSPVPVLTVRGDQSSK